MLQKHLRLLLIASLVAMVPVQGLAALSMGICRDLQRSPDRALHERAASSSSVGHGHSHDAHGAPAGQSANDSDTTGDPHSAHCAACASCGVSAGIDAQIAFSIAEAPRDGVAAHAGALFSGIVPEALDRPPLTPRA